MTKPSFTLSIAAFAFVALMSGCASKPLSSVDRSKYGKVGFDENVKVPEKYDYTDATMVGTTAVAGNFGLIGALAGAAINAGHEGTARQKVDEVIRLAKVVPSKAVSTQFRKEVEALGVFDTKSGPPNARFKLEIQRWGFGPGGPDRLAAALTVRAQLLDTAGKSVWSRFVSATSPTTGTFEEFQADPTLYPRAFTEVVDVVARKLTGEWE